MLEDGQERTITFTIGSARGSVSGRGDRLFPLEFQRRVAKDRLGLDVDVVPGGHLAALSFPAELTAQLTGYLSGP